MIFRKAIAADARAIADIVKSSFLDYYLGEMIYGCHGIVQYLADLLSFDEAVSDSATFVAEFNNEVCAVAQFKKLSNSKTFYLSYICANESFRRNKLGSRLLQYALESEEFSYDTVSLDVFEHNIIAKNWYESLGFHLTQKKSWMQVRVEGAIAGSGYLANLPQSMTCYQKYGFSELLVVTCSDRYIVGVLGEKYYRISNPNIFEDLYAIEALRKFDSSRIFLLIGDDMECGLGNIEVKTFAKTLSLSISKEKLGESLASKINLHKRIS